MKFRVITGVMLFATSTFADAEAFGVQMGSPASRYGSHAAPGVANPYYAVITVPEPNSEFEAYSAVSTTQTGICKVSGIGRTHENDDYGNDLRSAFEGLKSVLNQRYGKSDDFDYLKTGALWKNPREFVWSIYKNERRLVSYWTASAGSSLPPGVDAIKLEALSVDPSAGAYVSLSYQFTNFQDCKKVMDHRENGGL